MNMLRSGVLCAAMFGLSACASIIDGSSQEIMVNTAPSGAACTLTREGTEIGRINPTPGSIIVEKTKHDLNIVCAMPGYQPTTYFNNSGTEGSTLGNIVLGGVIGWGVDSATGADNKYESPVNIVLLPANPIPDATGTFIVPEANAPVNIIAPTPATTEKAAEEPAPATVLETTAPAPLIDLQKE